MGADYIRPRTGLEAFQAVLAQRDAEGQPFIIVRGGRGFGVAAPPVATA
jgi:hypothetical protein